MDKEFTSLEAWNPFEISRVGEDTADGARLRAVLRGPQDSDYCGGEFVLDIVITVDYPFQPPRVSFVTNIFHPCVVPTIDAADHRRGDFPAASLPGGAIDLLELKDSWSPALNLNRLLSRIFKLLHDPVRATARTGHGGICQTASELLGDAIALRDGWDDAFTPVALPQEFQNEVRAWVVAHATPGIH